MTRGSLEMWCELRGAGRRGMRGWEEGMGWWWIAGMFFLLLGCCGTLPAKSASTSSSIPLTQLPPRMPGIKEKFLLHKEEELLKENGMTKKTGGKADGGEKPVLGCHPQPLSRASSPAAELEERVLEQAWGNKKPEREEKANRRYHMRVPGREFGRFSTA